MKTNKIFILILIPILLISFTGCITVNRQFSEVKDKILGELGDEYKTEFQFSVGAAAIHVSSWFVDMAADEEYVDDMIREISSVQIGVYNRVESSDSKADYGTLASIDEEMRSKGWKYIIRSLDGDDLTAIYVADDYDEVLQKMYIISLSDEELVIVEINGDLKKVIAYAIEERSFDLKM